MYFNNIMQSSLSNIYQKKGTLKIILNFFLKEKFAILCLLFCIFIGGITTSVDSLLIKYIINFIENTTKTTFENYTFFEFIKWPLIFFAWWEFLNITWRIYDYVYLKYIPKIKKNVVDSFFAEVQTYQYEYFKKSDASMIAPRIMDAARSIEMVYAIFIENIARKVIGIFSAFILLYNLHYSLFLVFATWVFLFMFVSFLCINRITRYSSEYGKTRARSNSVIANSILNIFNIKIFNGAKKEVQFLDNVTSDMQHKETIMQIFMLKLRYFLGSSSSVLVFSMVYFGISLKANDILTVGDIALLINICIAVGDDVWELMQEMGDLMEEYGAFAQSCDILKQILSSNNLDLINNQEHINKINNTLITKGIEIINKNYKGNINSSLDDIVINEFSSVKANIDIGKIEFKDVSFKYTEDLELFKNKKIIINNGEKVALVGSSGSGKSSFTHIIARIYNIQGGDILIGNKSIYKMSQDELSKHISFIAQEPILFERSIFDNIAYGVENPNMDNVIKAAKSAFIHDKIIKLKHSYDSLYGSKDCNLSVGEKQRIIIARAILKDAPIIILDEATSALDNITEQLVYKSLEELMQNKTVLTIAHRLQTILNMNRILLFDNGNIVEDGSHEELLAKKGLYYKLWNAQFKHKN
ncbi:MAG: ABC transporter ATP-binding protein [Rickettsiales bacterium]